MKTIYLAGGCFWGMQKFFDQFDGVLRTEVGYANGPDKAPSYRDVCASSGHAEPVRIDYPDIRDHRETEHLYLLLCADHTGVMLARDGFQTGSWQALLDAIEKAKQEAEEAAKLMEI